MSTKAPRQYVPVRYLAGARRVADRWHAKYRERIVQIGHLKAEIAAMTKQLEEERARYRELLVKSKAMQAALKTMWNQDA